MSGNSCKRCLCAPRGGVVLWLLGLLSPGSRRLPLLIVGLHAARASASRHVTPVLSHFPDEGKAAQETQGPCPRSHQRDGPRQSGSELHSELPCLSLAYGEPQPLPWADALGLCLTSLGAEPSGRACRRRPGQSPAPVAWGRCWGRGQRAARRGTCHTTTAPAARRTCNETARDPLLFW